MENILSTPFFLKSLSLCSHLSKIKGTDQMKQKLMHNELSSEHKLKRVR